MAKRLNYQIGLEVDNSQAKAAINEVISSLNTLGNKSSFSTTIQNANSAALDLARNLQSALNPNTGALDLSKFSDNLAKSGMTLKDYATQLNSLGYQGQSAFLKMASSIVSAETPLRRTNTLMSELWVTMKNTVRWQLTSSVLHGLASSVQEAYGYAKNLDRSLNDIRIVSGKSAEEMTTFAKQANAAAKALSTTTNDYAQAALIYYQQGRYTLLNQII